MSEEPDDFDRLLGSLAKEGRLQPDPDPGEHPGSGTLFAYHEGKLSPEERTRVEEHLSLCGRCRDLLVEYREFAEDPVEAAGEPGERGRVADFGAAADWKRLRERMGADGKESDIPSPIKIRGSEGRRSFRTTYSLAAILAVGIIGLSLYAWNHSWWDPRPQERVVEVFLPSTVRGDEEVVVNVVSEEEAVIKFSAEVEDPADYPRYTLQVLDERTREIVSVSDLVRQGSSYRFDLPSDLFVPGIYDLRVIGEGKGESQILAEYQIRFENPPAP